MTPSQLPVGLRTQQTIAAFYRAGYPIEEIADAIGLTPTTCQALLDAMRHAGWTLRRPRGAHEPVQIDNSFLREHYLRTRIPLGLALALGRALELDPREIEAREIRPQPARFHAPPRGLPALAAPDDDEQPPAAAPAVREAVAA